MASYESVEAFRKEREALNEIVLKYGKKNIKRFFNLDTQAYTDGALDAKTKEMLGLVASLVLRCDDCILYHIIRCFEEGVADDEIEEVLNIGLVVGGSIVIPHLRRAFKHWEELHMKAGSEKQQLFTLAYERIEKLGKDDFLKNICAILQETVPYYHWVGFYFLDSQNPNELVLGPFVGAPTDHVRIPVGKGICGQAVDTKKTFVVQDVTKETNYLSCSAHVKSEIVVPIFKDFNVVGEIDIDSHDTAPFSDDDREFLEKLCVLIAERI